MRLLTTRDTGIERDAENKFVNLMEQLNKYLSKQKGVKEIETAVLYKDFEDTYRVDFEYEKEGERREGNCSLFDLQLFVSPMSVQEQ